jgi:hypothetical protein
MTSKAQPRRPWFWEGGKYFAKENVLTCRESILNGNIQSAQIALFHQSNYDFMSRNFGERKNPGGSWVKNMNMGSTKDWWLYYRWKHGLEQLSIELLESNRISTIQAPNWNEIYPKIIK